MKYFFDNCISYKFARMLAAEEFDEVVGDRDNSRRISRTPSFSAS